MCPDRGRLRKSRPRVDGQGQAVSQGERQPQGSSKKPPGLPFNVSTDKHATYPEAFATSLREKVLPPDYMLRRVKYLYIVIK
jgi:hypothetical protein